MMPAELTGEAARARRPDLAFPEEVHQVDVLKIGHNRVIVPKGRRWDDLFRIGPRVSDDFRRSNILVHAR